MLRADKKAEIVKLPLTLRRLFTGRYTLASGKRTFDARWNKVEVEAILAQQAESPVELVRQDERAYWIFKGCFYWEDEDLNADDVKALALQRIRKRARQLATAHSVMRAEEAGGRFAPRFRWRSVGLCSSATEGGAWSVVGTSTCSTTT